MPEPQPGKKVGMLRRSHKAANWQWVGRTTGRGKKSTSHEQKLPIKDIWLYPLRRDYAEWLCR